ncbi:4'-phosphopantetheinyl transferase superfamily protein [Flagellimonas sp. HMM57]|uniref:4'-phosphopantetheinyl transferase family protein n=1 Tax=unclassified Flagellimonas TaxID=2644544 RepID=UPI0013D53E4A|nr:MULTISPECIES: 4'-phosphopantetheinyl transferase superfamily protein [unclassified Flagellimonas]UII76110.1 4'-phosphopantetheinyl transferase superfamily protein [Flagellimonas sp. HMM57]
MIQNKQSQIVCSESKIIFYDYSQLNWNSRKLKFFKIDISDFEHEVHRLTHFLEPHELLRSQRYRFKKDCNRFIISRTILKILLAKQTGTSVENISLKKDERKKPYLPLNPSVFFNLSHSGNCILIAISEVPVGIDVEKIDESFDFTPLLSQIFNTTEIKKLNNADQPLRTFYTFWTRKEAIVKATGKGITDNFIAIPSINGLHQIQSCLIGTTTKLQVNSFNIDNEYIGAIALTDETPTSKNIPCYKLYSNPIHH